MIPVSSRLTFSIAIAALMIVLTILDMFAGYPWRPFGGQVVFDICFLIASGVVLYMAHDVWQDHAKPRRQRRSSP